MVARGTFTLDRTLDATGWVCGMATRRNLQVIGAAASRKASPSALVLIVRTAFVLLAFGGVWLQNQSVPAPGVPGIQNA